MTYRKLQAALYGTATWLIVATLLMSGAVVAGEPVRRTFIVQGLHCPPCTSTVEAALKRTRGVESAKVEWKSKNAWITFDESVISAQQVAQAIAATPHLMGRNMHYQASLALQVPDLKDDVTSDKVEAALSKITGVAAVYPYPKQQSVSVRFQVTGKLTTDDLIAALKKAGFEATPF